MDKMGIKTLEEILKKNRWEDAIVSISHKLYGNQKIKCKLDDIVDAERIGVKVKSGQELFIYKNDLVGYSIKDDIYFADELMEIRIKL